MIRYAFVKLGMTSIFTESGEEKAVTVLKLQPAKVVRCETAESGKKIAVVEYDLSKKKNTEEGKNSKKRLIQKGWIIEGDMIAPQTELKAPAFEVGSKVVVTGTSKGRGFQDVITRHNFSGGPAAHGSRFHRAPGSIGMRTEPGRTPKGRKLPGQHGNVQVTLRNSEVAYWSEEEQMLALVGGVPGARGGLVYV